MQNIEYRIVRTRIQIKEQSMPRASLTRHDTNYGKCIYGLPGHSILRAYRGRNKSQCNFQATSLQCVNTPRPHRSPALRKTHFPRRALYSITESSNITTSSLQRWQCSLLQAPMTGTKRARERQRETRRLRTKNSDF